MSQRGMSYEYGGHQAASSQAQMPHQFTTAGQPPMPQLSSDAQNSFYQFPAQQQPNVGHSSFPAATQAMPNQFTSVSNGHAVATNVPAQSSLGHFQNRMSHVEVPQASLLGHPQFQSKEHPSSNAIGSIQGEPASGMPAQPSSSPGGLGIVLKESPGGRCVVAQLLPGSASERHSTMLPGDQIVAVNDQSVIGHSLDDVRGMIVGPEGSNVHVVFVRNDNGVWQQFENTLTRTAVDPNQASVAAREHSSSNSIEMVRQESMNKQSTAPHSSPSDEFNTRQQQNTAGDSAVMPSLPAPQAMSTLPAIRPELPASMPAPAPGPSVSTSLVHSSSHMAAAGPRPIPAQVDVQPTSSTGLSSALPLSLPSIFGQSSSDESGNPASQQRPEHEDKSALLAQLKDYKDQIARLEKQVQSAPKLTADSEQKLADACHQLDTQVLANESLSRQVEYLQSQLQQSLEAESAARTALQMSAAKVPAVSQNAEEGILMQQASRLAMLALPHAAGHLTGSLSINGDQAGEASEHLLRDILVFSSRLASRAMPQNLELLTSALDGSLPAAESSGTEPMTALDASFALSLISLDSKGRIAICDTRGCVSSLCRCIIRCNNASTQGTFADESELVGRFAATALAQLAVMEQAQAQISQHPNIVRCLEHQITKVSQDPSSPVVAAVALANILLESNARQSLISDPEALSILVQIATIAPDENKPSASSAISVYSLGGLRNFTADQQCAVAMRTCCPEALDRLAYLATDADDSRARRYAAAILANCAANPSDEQLENADTRPSSLTEDFQEDGKKKGKEHQLTGAELESVVRMSMKEFDNGEVEYHF